MMVNALTGFGGNDPYVPGSITPVTSGSYSFNVPDGVATLFVTATGGGAGGGSQCGPNPGGNLYRSGGGGGACIDYPLAVSPGDLIEIVIGAGGSVSCGNVGGAGTAGGDTTISVNGVVALTLGGAPSYVGGDGPLPGDTSSGYFGTPGYSGAQAYGAIGTTYGKGGPASSDAYWTSYGTGGYAFIEW